MLVSEILSTVKCAYGCSWDEAFAGFEENSHEALRIAELMDEITARGQLEPGRIYRDEETDELILTNGTHRFYATVKLGLEDYPVEWDRNESELDDAESYELTELKFDVAVKLSEERHEKIMDCFSSSCSFALTDELWVECNGMSTQGNGIGFEGTVCFYPVVPPELHRELVLKVLERTACCMPKEIIEYLSVANHTHFLPKFWGSAED